MTSETLSSDLSLADLLTLDDLAQGKGSPAKVEAYRELEWRKCAADPVYFVEHYCFLKLKSGRAAPFRPMFPCQIETFRELQNGESPIQVKSRQLGQTTGISHYALWDIIFNEAVKWNFFGADEDASKDIKGRLDVTVDRLPQWMKDRAGVTESKQNRKKDGTMSIGFGMSEITLFSGSVKKAQGMSGKTFLDDFGKHTDAERKWQLIYPTIDDPNPANRGQIAIVFNGDGEDFCYHLYQQAKQGNSVLTPHFYSWKDDPRRLEGAYVEDGVTRYPWYEKAKQNYLFDNPDRDIMSFKAQFPDTEDEAFFISDVSRFDLRTLEGMKQLARRHKPKAGYVAEGEHGTYFRGHARDGYLNLYQPPTADARYIIGLDAAGGNGPNGDFSIAQVFRICAEHDRYEAFERAGWWKRDGRGEAEGHWKIPDIDGTPAFTPNLKDIVLEQVAVYAAKPEPVQFGKQAVKIAQFYNGALVVPEANSHGQTVINTMKSEGYLNIFKRTSRGDSYTDRDVEKYGFYTEQDSKVILIDTLADWLASGSVIVIDDPTIKELTKYRTFQTPTGKTRTSAPKGQHDDRVMALGMAVYGAAQQKVVSFTTYDFF